MVVLGAGILHTQTAPFPSPAQEAQEVSRLEQAVKEAAEMQSTQPGVVAEKLAPVLGEMRQRQQKGNMTPAIRKIFETAILLQTRTQAILLQPEQEVIDSLRELLIVNPAVDEGVLNPREKLLVQRIRTVETGRLQIQTVPSGAALTYLGMELGLTPLDLPLIAGTYRLRLRRQGYLDLDFDALVRPAEMSTIFHALRRRAVQLPLSIHGPSASVELDGKVAGTSQPYDAWIASQPADKRQEWASLVGQWGGDPTSSTYLLLQEVPVGEPVTLLFRAACFEPLSMRMTIAEEEVDWSRPFIVRPELKRVEMKKDTGTLEISSVPPGAEIWLDGTLLGRTPLSSQVCAGAHRIQIWDRAGQFNRSISVQSGRTSRINGILKPALAFLGVYARNTQNALRAADADSETVAKALASTSATFADPQVSIADIASLRKAGLPLERLLEGEAFTADTDLLVKRIAQNAGRVNMLLAALRTADKYTFRLYSTIHPFPDLIELARLDDDALRYLVTQLNKAEGAGMRLQVPDVGVEFLESPAGPVVIKIVHADAGGENPLSPGTVIRAIDRQSMTARELQSHLRSKKPGQTVTLEVSPREETVLMVPLTIRMSGAEYPWGIGEGFTNSTLTMLQHLVELDPISDQAKFASLSIAHGLMNLGEWKLALEQLSKTNLEPHKSGVCPGTVLYYQGRCYEELGDLNSARSYYSRAKDYPEATLGTPDGPEIAALAQRRLESLRN
jgi:hypothetical protein